jgi:TolB-like protein
MQIFRFSILVCLSIAVGWLVFAAEPNPPVPNPSSRSAESIAVMRFEAVGATPQEASAITDRMQEELLRPGTITLVDRSQIDAVLNEQAFQQTGCTTTECAVQVGRVLGARKLITGKITRLGASQWLVAASLIDVETAQTLRFESVPFEGTLFGLLGSVPPRLAGKLIASNPNSVAAPPSASFDMPNREPGPAKGFSLITGTSYHSGTLKPKVGSNLSYTTFGGITVGADYQWLLSDRWTVSPFFTVTTSVSVSGSLSSTYESAFFTLGGVELRRWTDSWFLGARAGLYGTNFTPAPESTSPALTISGTGFGLTGGHEWPSGWYLAATFDRVALSRVSSESPNQVSGNADETAIWLNAGFRWR